MVARLQLWHGLALLVVSGSGAVPEVDHVHMQMEPPPPAAHRPKLSNPLGSSLPARAGGGLGALRLLVSPKRSLALLPAALLAMYMLSPGLLTKLWLHVLCCFGSLIEPFDSVLPPRSVLRPFVTLVQRARRSYEDEHGLTHLREGQFFDDEDSAESDSESADSKAEDEAEAADTPQASAGSDVSEAGTTGSDDD